MSCCICLNDFNIENDIEYCCNTCNDGKICYECLDNIDGKICLAFCNFAPNKSNLKKYEDYQKGIKNFLKCPCCRVENWKHIFNNIIYDLNYKVTEYEVPLTEEDLLNDEKKIMLIYYKNSLINIDNDE